MSVIICSGCYEKFPLKQLKRCAGCLGTFYCSTECQKKHWPVHKHVCTPSPDGKKISRESIGNTNAEIIELVNELRDSVRASKIGPRLRKICVDRLDALENKTLVTSIQGSSKFLIPTSQVAELMRGLASVHRLLGDKCMAAMTEENARIVESSPEKMEKNGYIQGVDFVSTKSNIVVSTRDQCYH